MTDLKRPILMYVKAAMLLAIGLTASALILIDRPAWSTAALLALAAWGFARAYYFAFYVIEHYIDPGYRYAGLLDFLRYLARRRSGRPRA